MTPIAHINDIKDHVAALENRIPALESQNVTMRRALDAIVGLLHSDAQRKGEASLEATFDALELTATTALLGTRCLSGNRSTLTEGIGLISPLPRRQRFQSSAQPSEGIPAEEPAHAMEASKPANAIPIALWVIAILFGASWMAVPLYFVG